MILANTDRYIMGLMENLENLTGSLSEPLSMTGQLSSGTLSGISSELLSMTGHLSNAILRGVPVEIRIQEGTTLLQWKYEDETTWRDLIDLATIDYSTLSNLPTINGVQFIGEMRNHIITPSDEITTEELEEILDIT